MTLPRLVVRAAGIALLAFGISTAQAFAAEGEAGPAGKAAPTEKGASAEKGAAEVVVPATDTKATANKDAVTDECGKALDKLAAGDATALDSWDEQRRQALMAQNGASDAITCLAVAENDEKFCKLLPGEHKERCPKQVKMIGSLKGAPKDAFKARMIFEVCSPGGPAADCELIRDAITSHDAGKCSRLTKLDVHFCAALATSDASKCKPITDEGTQATCAAYAANDPKRCPKDDRDCGNMAKAFSVVAEKGLAGLGDVDPSAVAAVEGKKACAATIAQLKKDCGAL